MLLIRYECPACGWMGEKLKTGLSKGCVAIIECCPDCGLYKPFLVYIAGKEIKYVNKSGS